MFFVTATCLQSNRHLQRQNSDVAKQAETVRHAYAETHRAAHIARAREPSNSLRCFTESSMPNRSARKARARLETTTGTAKVAAKEASLASARRSAARARNAINNHDSDFEAFEQSSVRSTSSCYQARSNTRLSAQKPTPRVAS